MLLGGVGRLGADAAGERIRRVGVLTPFCDRRSGRAEARPGIRPGQSNVLRGILPTFRPKPRRLPRMLKSRQQSPEKLLARNQKRPNLTRSNRSGVHRPNRRIRIKRASPRACLRSVFTVTAVKAAFTCRVSSRTAANSARISPHAATVIDPEVGSG
jgi:hypothetical protein